MRELTVHRIESVPTDADVRHFDELGDRAKEQLARLLHEEAEVKTDPQAVEELCQCDIIKYTDYVAISTGEPGIGEQVSA